MPEGFYLTGDQVSRLGEMLRWYETMRHVFPGQVSGTQTRMQPDRRCKGLLKGAMDSTDATATVDNVSPIMGPNPTTSTTSTVTVYNAHDWDADDNAKCRFEYIRSSSRWDLYQVNCPAT